MAWFDLNYASQNSEQTLSLTCHTPRPFGGEYVNDETTELEHESQ
jgi:hypothetical protein